MTPQNCREESLQLLKKLPKFSLQLLIEEWMGADSVKVKARLMITGDGDFEAFALGELKTAQWEAIHIVASLAGASENEAAAVVVEGG